MCIKGNKIYVFLNSTMYTCDIYNGAKSYVFSTISCMQMVFLMAQNFIFYKGNALYTNDVYNGTKLYVFIMIRCMQMMFILAQNNSVLVYTAQLNSFAYLIGHEYELGPYVHKWKMILY